VRRLDCFARLVLDVVVARHAGESHGTSPQVWDSSVGWLLWLTRGSHWPLPVRRMGSGGSALVVGVESLITCLVAAGGWWPTKSTTPARAACRANLQRQAVICRALENDDLCVMPAGDTSPRRRPCTRGAIGRPTFRSTAGFGRTTLINRALIASPADRAVYECFPTSNDGSAGV